MSVDPTFHTCLHSLNSAIRSDVLTQHPYPEHQRRCGTVPIVSNNLPLSQHSVCTALSIMPILKAAFAHIITHMHIKVNPPVHCANRSLPTGTTYDTMLNSYVNHLTRHPQSRWIRSKFTKPSCTDFSLQTYVIFTLTPTCALNCRPAVVFA